MSTLPPERRDTQQPLAAFMHTSGDIESTLQFLKRTRNELRMLRMVRIWPDRLRVFDVNGDYFEVRGVGYPDDDIVPILKAVHTAFNPDLIHLPIDSEFKEFKTGKRHPWAEDRLM